MTYCKQKQNVQSKTGKSRSQIRAPTIWLPQVMTVSTNRTGFKEIFCIFEGMTIMSGDKQASRYKYWKVLKSALSHTSSQAG